MERLEIKKLFESPENYADKSVTVYGWIRTLRDSKAIGFIELNDGSCFKSVQVVFEASKLENYKDIAKQNVGAAVKVTGRLLLTPQANQPFEIVAAEEFTADNSTDFSVQLQKVKDAGADLVFLPIYYEAAAAILTQAAAMNFAPTFFGCDGLDGILAVEGFDVTLAEGVMLLTPFAADAQDDLTVKFVASYQEKYGEIPNQFAADAYDAAYAIKAAAEKADVKPSMSASEICDALKVSMTEITVNGLTGENMSWEASGEPNKAPKAVVIKDGAYAAL